MRPLVFTDLDDTLFQTRRKISESQRASLTLAATAVDGNPEKSSWMTTRQLSLVQWLSETTEVIPVTARSAASFHNLEIPLDGWAIISNGATILEPDGSVHGPWHDRMADKLAPHAGTLESLLHSGRDTADALGLDMRSWVVSDAGLSTYVVFKINRSEANGDELEGLTFEDHDLSGWVCHRNANNLALIPPGSGKRAAVVYLREHLDPKGQRLTISAGDSLSDLDFMQHADLLLVPSASQISRQRLKT